MNKNSNAFATQTLFIFSFIRKRNRFRDDVDGATAARKAQ